MQAVQRLLALRVQVPNYDHIFAQMRNPVLQLLLPTRTGILNLRFLGFLLYTKKRCICFVLGLGFRLGSRL